MYYVKVWLCSAWLSAHVVHSHRLPVRMFLYVCLFVWQAV